MCYIFLDRPDFSCFSQFLRVIEREIKREIMSKLNRLENTGKYNKVSNKRNIKDRKPVTL